MTWVVTEGSFRCFGFFGVPGWQSGNALASRSMGVDNRGLDAGASGSLGPHGFKSHPRRQTTQITFKSLSRAQSF